MADNVTLNSGTGGAVLATDDASGVHYQEVKLIDGTKEGTTPIASGNGTNTNAMRVTIASDSTGAITANLGATDNAVLDTIDAVLDAINAKLVSGTVIGDVNLGATDNAVLDAIDTVLDAINAKLVTGTVIGDVNLGATDNAVLDNIDTNTTGLAGCVSGSELQVDIVSGGTGSTQYAEDTTHNTGDTGTMALAVRNDTLAALAGTDGDYAPVQVNAAGALYVDGSDSTQPVSGTVTANLSATDNAVLDTIDAVLDAINAKLAGGTVIGDVNLGATDNAVLDSIATNTTGLAGTVSGSELQVDVVAALPAGTNSIGKLAANDGVDIGDVDVTSISAGSNLVGDVGISGARTSGGTTLYRNPDVDETEDQIKGSAGQLYWIQCTNLDATPIYLQFYNVLAASVTVGTTTPDLSFCVPSQGDANGAGFVLAIPNGIAFSTAITVAATTTVGGAGGPGTNEVLLNLGYA